MRGNIFDTSREKTPGGVSHCLLFSAQPSPSWPAFHFPYGSEPASSSKREIREPLEQTPELPGHGSLGRSLGKAGQRSDGLCCFGKQPHQRACGDGAEHHKDTRRVRLSQPEPRTSGDRYAEDTAGAHEPQHRALFPPCAHKGGDRAAPESHPSIMSPRTPLSQAEEPNHRAANGSACSHRIRTDPMHVARHQFGDLQQL